MPNSHVLVMAEVRMGNANETLPLVLPADGSFTVANVQSKLFRQAQRCLHDPSRKLPALCSLDPGATSFHYQGVPLSHVVNKSLSYLCPGMETGLSIHGGFRASFKAVEAAGKLCCKLGVI